MKKLFLISVILLTGCVSNADFEKECINIIDSNHIKEKIVMDIFYDNNDITKNVTYFRNFKVLDEEGKETLEKIKEASLTYNRRYNGKGINIVISKDSEEEFEMKYNFDVRKIDNKTLKEFDLKKNSIKLFRDLRKKGLDCEVKDGNN